MTTRINLVIGFVRNRIEILWFLVVPVIWGGTLNFLGRFGTRLAEI